MLRAIGSSVEIDVQAVPGARKTEIVGLHGDKIRIKVHAPPVDGKANLELCAFIAQLCSCAKSSVTVTRGHAARQKTLRIQGVSLAFVQQILAAYISGSPS